MPAAAARARPLGTRIRGALERWDRGNDRDTARSVGRNSSQDVHRGDAAAGLPAIRTYFRRPIPVTASEAENAAAAAAMAAGETAALQHMADARQQHQASGSTVVIEQPSTADDISVTWPPGTPDDSAQPTLIPSEPRPINRQPGPTAA